MMCANLGVKVLLVWAALAVATATLDPPPCKLDGKGGVYCGRTSNITTMDQFFAQDLPQRNFSSFTWETPNVDIPHGFQVLRNIFHGASFESIDIFWTHLIGITSDAFSDSEQVLKDFTLWRYNLYNSQVDKGVNLTFGRSAKSARFELGVFQTYPSISCNGQLAQESFDVSFEHSFLSNCGLPSGFWKYCSSNHSSLTLNLPQCQPRNGFTVAQDSFYVGDKTASNFSINLFGMVNVQSVTFTPGFINTDVLKESDMASIHLTLTGMAYLTIAEDVFGEYFANKNMDFNLHLEHGLVCNCSIAWLVRHPAYFARVSQEGPCDDGRPLHSLTPQDFANC